MKAPEVSPTELKREIDSGFSPTIVDVREPDEIEISALADALHIPLADLPARSAELDKEGNLVILCRTGNRSGQAAALLLDQGFKRVRNLAGGINGWARDVDPSLPLY